MLLGNKTRQVRTLLVLGALSGIVACAQIAGVSGWENVDCVGSCGGASDASLDASGPDSPDVSAGHGGAAGNPGGAGGGGAGGGAAGNPGGAGGGAAGNPGGAGGGAAGAGRCSGVGGAAGTSGGAGSGPFQLVVCKDGDGSGLVQSDPPAIDCGSKCDATYTKATSVTLYAFPDPGSLFTGWTGGCTGRARTCTLNVDANKDVIATFIKQLNNVVFVTSASYPHDTGGLAGADAKCQAHAASAGFTGTFRAWLSTSTVTAASRLAGARGWTLVDGRPVADLVTDLVPDNKLMNAIYVDENGRSVTSAVLTGTMPNGAASGATCHDWTGPNASPAVGESMGGPYAWTFVYYQNGGSWCSSSTPFYCFQVAQNTPLVRTTSAGKLVFVTTNNVSPLGLGLPGADARCRSDATAAGLSGVFKALLATTSASAASRFTPAPPYVRPDGQVVSTGDALFTGKSLRSGIWQTAKGAYVDAGMNGSSGITAGAWTGAASPTDVGTLASTCQNWMTAPATAVPAGSPTLIDARWFNFPYSEHCDSSARLYCVED
jgi:trimeric autotransporter adhesin